MYRLTVDGVETYMVVTRNVFSHRLTVHRKYDLKVQGFVFPRSMAAPSLRFRGATTPTATSWESQSICLAWTGDSGVDMPNSCGPKAV